LNSCWTALKNSTGVGVAISSGRRLEVRKLIKCLA
jgi:hypothetical protein